MPVVERKELPASLKPKLSEFGSFVFFDETPQQEIPKTMPTEEPASDEEDQKQEQVQPQIIQKKQEAAPEKPVEKVIENKPAPKKEVVQPKPTQTTQLPEIQEKKTPQDVQERIKEIEEQQKQMTALESQQKELSTQDILQQIRKPKPPKRKKRNILAMTKGYLENLKDEGEDWLERKGDDSKRPSFEELKYLSYEQRINWQLQASWKRNFSRSAHYHLAEGKAVIDFTIDANGKLSHVKLLQSSGNQELDDVILKNLKLAAPFPPLPKHFNKKEYSSGRIIHVQASRFGF